MTNARGLPAALAFVALLSACDFEAARQRYTDDFCQRTCLESPDTAGCAECRGFDGGGGGVGGGGGDAGAGGGGGGGADDAGSGGGTGGGDAGVGGGTGGGTTTAVRVGVSPDAGIVNACVALGLQPLDAQGTPAAVGGGGVAVSVSCTPAADFFGGGACAGSPGVAVTVDGPGPAVASVRLSQVSTYECVTSASPPLVASPFSLAGLAALRVEVVGGGSEVTQERCVQLRVRSADALGSSVAMPVTSALSVSVDGGFVGLSSACDDLDAGLGLTIPSGNTTASFYARVTGQSGDAGRTLVVWAEPAPGVLAVAGEAAFSVTCLASGQSCGSTPGACCNGCNALASNTCY